MDRHAASAAGGTAAAQCSAVSPLLLLAVHAAPCPTSHGTTSAAAPAQANIRGWSPLWLGLFRNWATFCLPWQATHLRHPARWRSGGTAEVGTVTQALGVTPDGPAHQRPGPRRGIGTTACQCPASNVVGGTPRAAPSWERLLLRSGAGAGGPKGQRRHLGAEGCPALTMSANS